MIAASLSLSWVTVRRAMSLLEEGGRLSRRHGARTEIGLLPEQRAGVLKSFTEQICIRGQVPGSIWLSKPIARASSQELMALGVAGSANVLRIERARTANSNPIAVEVSVIPECYLPSADLVHGSLYQALKKRGFMPNRAIQRVSSQRATIDNARHLRCEVGAPLLVMERRCFLIDGKIVELCETRYRSDAHDFVFEVTRQDR